MPHVFQPSLPCRAQQRVAYDVYLGQNLVEGRRATMLVDEGSSRQLLAASGSISLLSVAHSKSSRHHKTQTHHTCKKNATKQRPPPEMQRGSRSAVARQSSGDVARLGLHARAPVPQQPHNPPHSKPLNIRPLLLLAPAHSSAQTLQPSLHALLRIPPPSTPPA